GGLEVCLDPRVRLGDVRENLELAVDHDRQRGRLYASGRPGRLLAPRLEPARERAGRVHADQPVRVRAAASGRAQGVVALAGLETGEAVADGLGRHRAQPQSLDRLLGLEVVEDLAEDQLAFAPRVARVHDPVHVLALEQLLDRAQAVRVSRLL